MQPIIAPVDQCRLSDEIGSLEKNNLVASRGNFEVYLIKAGNYPIILKEIGRLRELTFRAAGEGTGKELDVDKFDKYYFNLFIWDREKQNIVGGYRVGPGSIIF